MEKNLRNAPENAMPYDYRQYDQVWQRVAPSLNPYSGAVSASSMGGTPPGSEESLPGAVSDPCCMGTAAQEMLEVLEGFVEEEMADCRYYQEFARQAPASARPVLREMARDEGGHARRLMAVYYLITGRCYQSTISCDRIYIGPYCPALRERYHAEACGGLNYIRAAEGTTDPCLQKIFRELSEDEYRHAERLSALLERALTGACNGIRMGV